MNPSLRSRRVILATMLLLLPGCPLGDPAIGPCTELDPGGAVAHQESVIGGDATTILLERAGYAVCAAPTNSVDIIDPVELAWVRLSLPDLTASALSPALPADALLLASDGHWIVYLDLENGLLMLSDLDAGTQRPLSIETRSFRAIEAVARPYILLRSAAGGSVVNGETGDTIAFGSDAVEYAVLTSTFVAYSEWTGPAQRRIKLLDLQTGEERVLVENESVIDRLYAAPGRVIWIGAFNTVHVYDLAGGSASVLTRLGLGFADPFAPLIRDVGEPGILLLRFQSPFSAAAPVSLELLRYDGQTTTIDTVTPVSTYRGLYGGPGGTFAGPYVVYRKDEKWVIYNIDDDTRREVVPFAQPPPGSQPGP